MTFVTIRFKNQYTACILIDIIKSRFVIALNFICILCSADTMESAFFPMLLLSRVFATFSHSRENIFLQSCHKLYCFVVCGYLSYVNVQLLQEMQGTNNTGENVISKYCSLIFSNFALLLNWLSIYRAFFNSAQIVELIKELTTIAVSLKCEHRVAKNTKVYLMKYMAVFVAGTILCLRQELSTYEEVFQLYYRIIISFSSTIRIVWYEIQVTTFAYTTGLLLSEINIRIAVRKLIRSAKLLISFHRICKVTRKAAH